MVGERMVPLLVHHHHGLPRLLGVARRGCRMPGRVIVVRDVSGSVRLVAPRPDPGPGMPLILAGLGLLLLGAIAALAAARAPRLATLLGVGGTIAGCACALVPVVRVLLGGAPRSLALPWSVPFGTFALGLDPLSAFFLLPILALSALAAVYGGEYLGAYRGRAVPGRAWLFFALLVASMALVALARNGVLFLVAWEIMALASFFLVMFDDEDAGGAPRGLDLPGRHAPRHGVPARVVRAAGARRRARSISSASAPPVRSPPRWPACSSCSRSSASAPRPASCRCTSGCPRRTRPRPATSRRSCPA